MRAEWRGGSEHESVPNRVGGLVRQRVRRCVGATGAGEPAEAWIAPPATRELRELVRHRAKLVGIRSNCKAQIHAVLAKCGIQVSMTDLFGLAGTELLDRLELPRPYAARIASLRRIIGALDFEIDAFAGQVRGRLARDPG